MSYSYDVGFSKGLSIWLLAFYFFMLRKNSQGEAFFKPYLDLLFGKQNG